MGKKMKATSVENKEITAVDSSSFGESSVLSDNLSEENQSSGLTQSMINFTVDNSDPRFRVPVDTAHYYPEKVTNCLK